MMHRTILATLLVAFNLATCIAQEKQPAFETRQAGRAAEEKLDWQIAVAAYSFRQFTFFGVGKLEKMLETVAKVKKGPVLFSVEYNSNPANPSRDVKKCMEFLDAQAIRLAKPAP